MLNYDSDWFFTLRPPLQAEQEHDGGGVEDDGHEQSQEGQEAGSQVQLRFFLIIAFEYVCLFATEYK